MFKSKKMRNTLLLSVVTIAFISLGLQQYRNYKEKQADKEKVLIQTIVARLNQFHFDPPSFDDDFSAKIFNLYLERIDNGKRFFTKQEIAQLEPYKTLLDNETSDGQYDFFNLTETLFDQQLSKVEAFVETHTKKAFDYTKGGKVELDGDKRSFEVNDAALEKYWINLIRYQIVSRIESKLDEQAQSDYEGEIKTFDELEVEQREKTKSTYESWFKRLRKQDREDRLSGYINCITNIYDPHTNYYKPQDKEDFDISMSGTLEGIGARLQSDGDETKVTEVVVGGPAWKQGDLEADDVIIKVGQGEEEPVDIMGWDISDVVAIVRGSKGSEVRLTVKKKTGAERIIKITRDIVVMEESFAKSLILSDKDDESGNGYGYIYLPKFYADFNRKDGRRCAIDVEVELNKLKEQDVKGVILDLRNNGGGSLKDVVEMSGLFINKGPIVQVKGRSSKQRVMEDTDATVQYSGPLVVMVNKFSASASEILAAAMQDYKRAVIIGSQTFGKGTVQSFFDLDRGVGYDDMKPFGQLKLTTQKFYRIDGGSTQLRGVTPDIALPDDYTYIEYGEREEEYPLPWSHIDEVKHEQDIFRVKNMSEIITKSTERIQSNPLFAEIDDNARRFEEQREATLVPTTYKEYKLLDDEIDAAEESYDSLFHPIEGFLVANIPSDLQHIQADTNRLRRHNEWIKQIEKDVQLHESLQVLKDLN